jgi:hypothetical protein
MCVFTKPMGKGTGAMGREIESRQGIGYRVVVFKKKKRVVVCHLDTSKQL